MGEPIMIERLVKLRYLLLVCFMGLSSMSHAVIELVEFDTEQEKVRYQVLIDELRCPKCQNQNLADSDAQIAVDLRNKVRELMDQGKSDDEIKTHLVARYGDFVLYRPEVKKETYVLWYAPVILLLVGFLVVIFVVVSNKKSSEKDEVSFGSEDERQEKLRSLMKEKSEKE